MRNREYFKLGIVQGTGRSSSSHKGSRAVALPRLATGVGGLDWNDVLPLVKQHLGDHAIPVSVYSTFRAGVAADEPLPAKRR